MSRRFSIVLMLGLLMLAACAAPQGVSNTPVSGRNQAAASPPTQPAAAAPTVALAAAPTEAVATSESTSAPTEVMAATAPAAAPTEAAAAAAPTAAQAGSTTAAPATTGTNNTASGDPIHLVLVPQGTEARYMAREVLAGHTLPSDAIGKTSAVTGQVVIQQDGKLVPGASKFVVDMNTLQSDVSMRDGFIKRSTLQTDQYPTAQFVPMSVQGLPSPLPTSGDVNFTITGDMTAHGVTRPATWQVTGKVAGNEMTGTATYSFTFADFNMSKPQVPRVLSLEDTINLELDFHLVKQ